MHMGMTQCHCPTECIEFFFPPSPFQLPGADGAGVEVVDEEEDADEAVPGDNCASLPFLYTHCLYRIFFFHTFCLLRKYFCLIFFFFFFLPCILSCVFAFCTLNHVLKKCLHNVFHNNWIFGKKGSKYFISFWFQKVSFSPFQNLQYVN